MKWTKQVTWTMAAFFAVVVLVGSAGCTVLGFEGTPAGQTPPEIAGVHPLDGSQTCPSPQVGVVLPLTDAMRRDGAFDRSTVQLTLDGNDVTGEAEVIGSMDYPQSRVSLLYTPATPLALGTHRAAFTFPLAGGRNSFEWTFTVANIPCPPAEGGAVGQPTGSGMAIGGSLPIFGTPQPSNLPSEIAGFHPLEGIQTCPSPQVGVDLRLTDAMRRDGAFDRSTVTLTLDGNDVTKEAGVRGSMDYPQSRVLLLYTPATPLVLGTHRAAFTFPSASGRSSVEWTFTVANIPCPPPQDEIVVYPGSGTPVTPGALADIAIVHPPEGSQVCPRPQIQVDLHLTDAMRRDGVFDRSTVTLTLDGNDVTQQAEVLGTMTYPQSQVSLSYTPTTALATGTHQAAITYPSTTGRKTHAWTFTVANITCP